MLKNVLKTDDDGTGGWKTLERLMGSADNSEYQEAVSEMDR